jgi:Rieske Fe-S protein
MTTPTRSDHACPRSLDRRAFLRDTALAAAAALVAAGLAPTAAFAESVAAISPISVTAKERLYAIPASDGVTVDEAESVVFARWQGKLFAFSIKCPHRGEIVEWHASERQMYCPKHKARWTPGGDWVSGRQTRDLDRYALRRDGGRVAITVDQPLRADLHADAWAAAALTV